MAKINVNLIYPIGSIYMSVNSTNPSILFGGTWEKIQGRFLLGAGTPTQNNSSSFGTLNNDALGLNFTVGDTSGEVWHDLNINEIPRHRHDQILLADNYLTAWADTGQKGFDLGSIFQSGGLSQTTNLASTSYTGGSGGHNNIPPYFVVNIWKRTA